MKVLKTFLALFLLFLLIGCENRVETAKKLWENKKPQEAISKLRLELEKQPTNNDAKSLLEHYQASIWLEKAKSLWQAGEKDQATNILKTAVTEYPKNEQLNKLYNSYDKLYLSREKAAKLISKLFPVRIEGELDVGQNLTAYLETKTLKALHDKGLIRYQFLRKFGLSDKVSVELTDEGKKYVKGTGKRPWPNKGQVFVIVRLCEKKFLGVTGMKFGEFFGKTVAEVDYQWSYSDFTPFGRLWESRSLFGIMKYDESQHDKNATFVLYDDGWRLEK